MQWEPIDTAPRDQMQRVLIFDPRAGHAYDAIRIDAWDLIGYDANNTPVYGWDGQPTHWMPLPAPPASSPEIPISWRWLAAIAFMLLAGGLWW